VPDGDAGTRIGLVGGRPSDWNELVVSVHSGRTVVHLNGDRIADLKSGTGGGPAAVEMVGEGSQVQLKSVDLLGAPKRD
jgi:hypothetical protein